MHAYYADHFVLPLPDTHRFPMSKYARLRERLLSEGILSPEKLHVPPAATDEQILLAHSHDYLERAKHGALTEREIKRIGFPWSPQMIERSRRSSGATIAAARTALQDGISANLAGGTHHAGRSHGEGYCVFNDSAIAARVLQKEGYVQRVIVIDCDVHQGNGTAEITHGDDSIYTFSIHGEKNFPFRKFQSDMDIGLPDDTGDDEYLTMLEIGLERALYTAKSDFAFYIAGADPYSGDRLGKLALTKQGLAARDTLVLTLCHAQRIPVAISMGGGYAPHVEDIVDIHLRTIQIATEFAANW
jgi:acetoin utilization deacetylase AcuC-like enzyme